MIFKNKILTHCGVPTNVNLLYKGLYIANKLNFIEKYNSLEEIINGSKEKHSVEENLKKCDLVECVTFFGQDLDLIKESLNNHYHFLIKKLQTQYLGDIERKNTIGESENIYKLLILLK